MAVFGLPDGISWFPYQYPLQDGIGSMKSSGTCRSSPGPFREERRDTGSRAQKQLGS